ncbi:MAG: hypothetical protein FJY99_05210, partial [Candidatus Sericytochromatia bacterium]|nr:hypothetical protein [Candidatus Tanganyikabacteria bacterium]
ISSRIQAGKKDGSLSLDGAKGLRTDLQGIRGNTAVDRLGGGSFTKVEKLQSRMSLDDLSGEVRKTRRGQGARVRRTGVSSSREAPPRAIEDGQLARPGKRTGTRRVRRNKKARGSRADAPGRIERQKLVRTSRKPRLGQR